MPDRAGTESSSARQAMLEEVAQGLSRTPKEISPKYFYDRYGSELFEEITRLPEYYLTRTERILLESWITDIVEALSPRTVVELGAGSGDKTRIILDAVRAQAPAGVERAYIPIDISREFLEEAAARLRADYPDLAVWPVVADITGELRLPPDAHGPALFAFLGSTIGNFDRTSAVRLLQRIRAAMGPGDRLLLGVDLRKDPARIEAAYNDAAGVTAEFNRNALRVLNQELHASFVPERFEHRAFYNAEHHQVEMQLVSREAQTASIPGLPPIHLAPGEPIRTEISCKYDRRTIEQMFAESGLRLEGWRTDPEQLFALALAGPAEIRSSGRRQWRALERHVRERLFAPLPGAAGGRRAIGAEVELIPIDLSTSRAAPLNDHTGVSTLSLVRRFASQSGWIETRTATGAPCFRAGDGGTITFEPGGQLEYSAPPCRSATALIRRLSATVGRLRLLAGQIGLELLAVGLDPFTPAPAATVQLPTERYRRMGDYFATLGPAGARMMRQTAAFQITLDLEEEAPERWRLLNALTPYLVAIFANSPLYQGEPTGYLSYRAHTWRELDPRRTGLPYEPRDPIGTYLEFALDAPALLLREPGGDYPTFREWARRHPATGPEWQDHLTTLFPEIRPRGYFEVRTLDALDEEWYPAPIAFLSGLAYDPEASAAAIAILGEPDPQLLGRAGAVGLRDPAIARISRELVEVAFAGCARLQPDFLHPTDLERAAEFFGRYTRRGRCPADDRLTAFRVV